MNWASDETSVPCLRRYDRARAIVWRISAAFVVLCILLLLALSIDSFASHAKSSRLVRFIVAMALCYPIFLAAALLVTNLRAERVRSKARQLRGCLCLHCAYILPDADSGVCPECGTAFTLRANQEAWGCAPRPVPRHGASETTDR